MVSGKATAAIAGAGIASLLTWILTHPAEAKAAPAPEGVDPDAWNAVIGIINAIEAQNARLEEALAGVVNLLSGGSAGYALVNPDTFTTGTVVTQAAGTPARLPGKIVPYNMEFVVKALSTNGGLIYVANTGPDSAIPTASYTLLPNEAVGLKIKNSNQCWISSQFGGEGITFIVEQR